MSIRRKSTWFVVPFAGHLGSESNMEKFYKTKQTIYYIPFSAHPILSSLILSYTGMLPTARRVTIRHQNPCIWRTYATQSIHGPESYSRSPEQTSSWDNGRDERTKIPRTSLALRTIHVRSWETIKSMADVFVILRGIERKYGRIRDFRFVRVNCSLSNNSGVRVY
jgi:hypothetical protein